MTFIGLLPSIKLRLVSLRLGHLDWNQKTKYQYLTNVQKKYDMAVGVQILMLHWQVFNKATNI